MASTDGGGGGWGGGWRQMRTCRRQSGTKVEEREREGNGVCDRSESLGGD